MRYILVILSLCLLVISAQAGTYKNDFTDGNLDGWKIEDYGVPKVEWKVDNGILACNRPHDWNTELYFGEKEWKNYSIECDVKMLEIFLLNGY